MCLCTDTYPCQLLVTAIHQVSLPDAAAVVLLTSQVPFTIQPAEVHVAVGAGYVTFQPLSHIPMQMLPLLTPGPLHLLGKLPWFNWGAALQGFAHKSLQLLLMHSKVSAHVHRSRTAENLTGGSWQLVTAQFVTPPALLSAELLKLLVSIT